MDNHSSVFDRIDFFKTFLLDTPLFSVISCPSDFQQLRVDFPVSFDSYCPFCDREDILFNRILATKTTVTPPRRVDKTYIHHKYKDPHFGHPYSDSIHYIELFCSRDQSHRFSFFYIFDEDSITKVGQYPSFEQLSSSSLNKYRSFLDPSIFDDLTKAVSLYSQSYSVASFTYMRRVFEQLINSSFSSNESEMSIDIAKFSKFKMQQKVEALSDFLPPISVRFADAGIYPILSKGIHELSEFECSSMFPVLRDSIFRILDAEIERNIREKSDSSLEKSLADFKNNLSRNS